MHVLAGTNQFLLVLGNTGIQAKLPQLARHPGWNGLQTRGHHMLLHPNQTCVAPQRLTATFAGADDFLPVLIYVVIKANLPQLASNLEYIQRFRMHSRMAAEFAYFYTQLVSIQALAHSPPVRGLSLWALDVWDCAIKVLNSADGCAPVVVDHPCMAVTFA